MKKSIGSLIFCGFFVLVLLAFFAMNIKNFTLEVMKMAEDKAKLGDLKSAFQEIELSLKSNAKYKGKAADVYGLGLKVLNKSIIGNMEFIKGRDGGISYLTSGFDNRLFADSLIELKHHLDDKNIPILFVRLPKKNLTEDEADISGYTKYNECVDDLVDKLSDAGIGILDMNNILNEKDLAEYYFKTDLHATTIAEFKTAKVVVNHLSDVYDIDFNSADQVFDINNYTVASYPFLGNTAREIGSNYAGVDWFQIFHPKFATSMSLNVFDNSFNKSGSYDDVCLNGFENNPDKDIFDKVKYFYWVINYMQYPNSWYEVDNYNCESGANLLVLSDSLAMRCNSFLSLACRNVTINDLRSNTS